MEKLPSRTFWLISKVEAGRMSILTANLGDERRALPVFSFAEEAEAYLGPGRSRWRVRETAVGELISVLAGPCAGVGRVLLDPVPYLDGRTLSEIVGVESKVFVEHLLPSRKRRPRPPSREKPFGRRRARLRTAVQPR